MDNKETKNIEEVLVPLTAKETLIAIKEVQDEKIADTVKVETPEDLITGDDWLEKQAETKVNYVPDFTVLGHDNDVIFPRDDSGHAYSLKHSTGFTGVEHNFINAFTEIQFLEKGEVMNAGITNEQLLIVLIDRTIRFNEKFPSNENVAAIEAMAYALECFNIRHQDKA